MPITFTEEDFAEPKLKFTEEDFGEGPPPLPSAPGPATAPEELALPTGGLKDIGAGFNVAGRAMIGGLADVGKAFFRPLTDELYPQQATRGRIEAPFENLAVAPMPEIPLPAKNLKPLPRPAQFVGGAAQGLIETVPKMAAVSGMQMAGIPAPIGAAAVFGTTEQGFDPKQAAIAAALPVAGKFSGWLVGRMADVLGVKSVNALNWMQNISGTAGPAGLLWAEGEREIAKLPKEQQDEARLELWKSIAGQAALGPMGVKQRKGIDAIQRESPQILRDVQAQSRQGAGQVPQQGGIGQAGERGGQGPEVSEAEQKRLLLKSKGEASLQQAQDTGNEGLIQIAQEQLDEINRTIERERTEERDKAEAALHPYEREELQRQRLDDEIQRLEKDPAVSGAAVYAGRNPDGTPRFETMAQDRQKQNRLRQLKAQREPTGDYTDAEFDADIQKHLVEHSQEKFGRKAKVKGGPGELPPEVEQPFAYGEYGRPNARGEMEFLGWFLRGKLARMKPSLRAKYLNSLSTHEAVHTYTTNAEAEAYLDSMSGIEQNINYRIYTGHWNPSELRAAARGRVREFSKSDLGHEAIRRRLEKLFTGTTQENVDASFKEKMSVASWDALARIIRATREGLVRGEGTKTQAGLKVLDDVLGRINDVKNGIVRQPEERRAAAFEKPVSDATKEFQDRFQSGDFPRGNVHTTEAGMGAKSLSDLNAFLEMNRKTNEQLAEFKQKLTDPKISAEEKQRLLPEYVMLGSRAQFPRESIEVATKVGSWADDMRDPALQGRERPLDWRKNPEVADWLRENGPKLGIALPEELMARPAAFEKQRENEERKARLTRAGSAADEQFLKSIRAIPASQLEQMLTQRQKYLESRERLGAGRLTPGIDIRNRKTFENQIRLMQQEIARRGEQAGPAAFDPKISDEDLWGKAVGRIGIPTPHLNPRQLETIKKNAGVSHAFVDDDGSLVKTHIMKNGVRIMIFPRDWNYGDKFGIAETVHDMGPRTVDQFRPEVARNVGQGTMRIPPSRNVDKELSLRAARELIWHYTREGGVPEWTEKIPSVDEAYFPATLDKPGDLPEQEKPATGPLLPPKPPSQQPELPKGAPVEPFREIPSSRVIEGAASQHLEKAMASGEAPKFDDYLGELQGRYGGGMTKEKAFYPWMDALARNLLTAPGENLRSMLRSMGLVPDVARATKPGEAHPFLEAIPDALPLTEDDMARAQRAVQTTMWPTEERITAQPTRRLPRRQAEAQRRRMAAIGAIFDRLAAEAGGRPKRERIVREVGPEDIDTKFIVLEPGEEIASETGEPTGEFTQGQVDSRRLFHRFTPEQAADPKQVAELATSGARIPNVKHNITKNLLALRNKINDRVIVVSAWNHERRGPVVTNPEGAGPNVRIDNKLLANYDPVAVMSLRAPVEDFRQVFQSPDEFSRWFGAEGIEGTPGVPSSSLTGPLAGVAREQAGISPKGVKPSPEEAIPVTEGEKPSPTARELSVPRFARKAVPAEPQPARVGPEPTEPSRMLSEADRAALEDRLKSAVGYEPTEYKPSPELEKRGIFLTPGARGERVPVEQTGMARFRKPVKKAPAAFDKYQDFANAYVHEMDRVFSLLARIPDFRRGDQLFDLFTEGRLHEAKLNLFEQGIFDEIRTHWNQIIKMGQENPEWTKLYVSKPQLTEGKPRVGPGVGPSAIEKPQEPFEPEKDRFKLNQMRALENADEFKRMLASLRSTPTSLLELWLNQPTPQPNEISEAALKLFHKSQQAIKDEIARRGENSFPAAIHKITPQKEYEYYEGRLRDKELLDHSLWLPFRQGTLLAVPVGGSRKSGSLGILETMTKDEANDLADNLRDAPGFPDVRVVKGPQMYEDVPAEQWLVEWGKPIDWTTGLNPETEQMRKQRRAYENLGWPVTGLRGDPTPEYHERLGRQFGYEQGYGVDYPTDDNPLPMPGEPYAQLGLFGKTYPAAFDKFTAAMQEGIDRVRDVSLEMWRTGALEDRMAQGLDEIGNRKNNEAHQAELNVRLASMKKPGLVEGLKIWRQHWTQGNREVLHAANAVVEAEGNQSKLQDFRDQLDVADQNADLMAQSNSWRARQNAKAYKRDIAASRAEVEYADAHWNDPALQLTARRVKRILDRQVRVEKANGINVRWQAGYVPHRLVDLWGEDTLFSLPGVIGTKFQAPRTFRNHYDALAAGPYMRITHDIASLVHHRVRQGLGKIYRDQWRAGLMDIDMPDGLKLAVKPIQLADGSVRSPSNNYQLVPTENFGYLAIHKDAAGMMKNLLSPSWVENNPKARRLLHWEQSLKHSLLIGDFFHFARMVYYGTSVIGRQALGMPANIGKYGWSALDIAPNDMQEAVRKGVITQREADWATTQVQGTGMTRRELVEKAYREHGANLGRISDALYKDLLTDLTPTAGKLRRAFVRVTDPTVGRYNRFLFDKMTRGLMAESIVREFERQYKTGMNPDALLRDISRDINERFGNIGRQGVLKSKTAQDLARILFLAPQWVEGMARTEARGVGRLSGVATMTGQREGLTKLGTTGYSLGKAMVFMFGLTQAINLITRGKPTWKNEEDGHKMDAWIPSAGGGDGFWFNPLSLFMELSHDLYRIAEARYQRGQELGGTLTQILSNKLSPLSRAMLVMGTGTTPTGQRITSTTRRMFTEPAKAMAPVPITFGKYAQFAGHAAAPGLIREVPKGQIQRQAIGTVGLKVEPALSTPAVIGRKAAAFMRKEGFKKETGWEQVQTDEASYTKLRSAIRDHDWAHARDLYNDLLKTRTEEDVNRGMSLSYKRPFTGSNEAEKLFIESLSEPELKMYQDAREKQMDDFEAFVGWVAQQP